MPNKYFKIELSAGVQIHVFFQTASEIIIKFVVKLVFEHENRHYEVVRFDTAFERQP
jgi:hypothetical protein